MHDQSEFSVHADSIRALGKCEMVYGPIAAQAPCYELVPPMYMGRWRSWLSHLSNTQKVLSSNLGRLMMFYLTQLAML